jgi:rod shape-determining protein MreB
VNRKGDPLRFWPIIFSVDIMEKGMVLSGGTSQLRNLPELFSQATGVPAFLADEAQLCVAKGTGIALENLRVRPEPTGPILFREI